VQVNETKRSVVARHVEPGIFHIHVDAVQLPPDMEAYCFGKLGMTSTDFSGHPEGFPHFEPQKHLTLKIRDGIRFRRTWSELEEFAKGTDFVGYLEGEFIINDEAFPVSAPNAVPVPFQIRRRRLKGPPEEPFREGELHLTLNADESDPQLIHRLLNSGLYGAFLPKPGGWTDLVLTAQGTREATEQLMTLLRRYVTQAGGAVGCTLKNERIVRYALFGVIPDELPEVIDSVVSLEAQPSRR